MYALFNLQVKQNILLSLIHCVVCLCHHVCMPMYICYRCCSSCCAQTSWHWGFGIPTVRLGDCCDVCYVVCLHCLGLKRAPWVKGTLCLQLLRKTRPGILENILKIKGLFPLVVKSGITGLSHTTGAPDEGHF